MAIGSPIFLLCPPGQHKLASSRYIQSANTALGSTGTPRARDRSLPRLTPSYELATPCDPPRAAATLESFRAGPGLLQTQPNARCQCTLNLPGRQSPSDPAATRAIRAVNLDKRQGTDTKVARHQTPRAGTRSCECPRLPNQATSHSRDRDVPSEHLRADVDRVPGSDQDHHVQPVGPAMRITSQAWGRPHFSPPASRGRSPSSGAITTCLPPRRAPAAGCISCGMRYSRS